MTTSTLGSGIDHLVTGPNVLFDRRGSKFYQHRVSRLLPRVMQSAEIEVRAGDTALDTTLILNTSFDDLDHSEHGDVGERCHEPVAPPWSGGGRYPAGLDERRDHLRQVVRGNTKFLCENSPGNRFAFGITDAAHRLESEIVFFVISSRIEVP